MTLEALIAERFTPHPCLPLPTPAQVEAIIARHGREKAPEVLAEIERRRKETIHLAEKDPFNHGFEFESWRDADRLLALPETRLLANLGANGSAKTTWLVKRAVQKAFLEPESNILLLHETELSSINVHQKFAYRFLPESIRPRDGWKPKKSVSTNIVYDSKGGFAANSLTTPIGGKITFGFYGQDSRGFEGEGYSFIGADENLPLSLLETLMFRLGRAGGKFVWCYTAIQGITPAIAAVIAGARTIEARPVDPEILPPTHRVSEDQDWPVGQMPYIMQGLRPEVKIIYMRADQNPLAGYAPEKGRGAFYGYRELVETLRSKSVAEKERRGYGWTRKAARTLFPGFCAAHVIPHEKMLARLREMPVTRYQIIDPASRNFFMIWFAVDAHERHYIYREWPDVPTHGEWAVPSDDARRWNGKRGPAQESLGYGVVEYKRLILELEGGGGGEGEGRKAEGEVIFERFIDPRSGATEAMATEAGESSVIDRFADEQTDSAGRVRGPAMILTPAISGKWERDGILQINELLAFNVAEPIVALLNEPHLYVSDACQNVIWALTNYAGREHEGAASKDEACKDPVDCVRYMALKKCTHVEPAALGGIAGGGW